MTNPYNAVRTLCWRVFYSGIYARMRNSHIIYGNAQEGCSIAMAAYSHNFFIVVGLRFCYITLYGVYRKWFKWAVLGFIRHIYYYAEAANKRATAKYTYTRKTLKLTRYEIRKNRFSKCLPRTHVNVVNGPFYCSFK